MNASKYIFLGSLQQFLDDAENSQAHAEWTNTKRYIGVLGIALCMKYLELKNDIHLNLSPENIFLDEYFYCHIVNSSLPNPSSTADSNVISFTKILYNIITLKNTAIEIDKILWPKNRRFFRKCISENSSEGPSFSEICRHIVTKGFIDLFGEIDYNEVNTFLDTFGDSEEISILKGIFNYESNDPTFNEIAKAIFKNLSEKGNKEAETFYEKSCQTFGGKFGMKIMVFFNFLENSKKSYQIYIGENMKIKEVKEYISERTGYNIDRSHIFNTMRILDDDEKVGYCGIQKGTLLVFVTPGIQKE